MTAISSNPLECTRSKGKIKGREIILNFPIAIRYFLSEETVRNLDLVLLDAEFNSLTDLVHTVLHSNIKQGKSEELMSLHICSLSHVPMKFLSLVNKTDKLWFGVELAIKLLITYKDNASVNEPLIGVMDEEKLFDRFLSTKNSSAYAFLNELLSRLNDESYVFTHETRVNLHNSITFDYYFINKVGYQYDMNSEIEQAFKTDLSKDSLKLKTESSLQLNNLLCAYLDMVKKLNLV